MQVSTISFLVWALLMLAAIGVLLIIARRGKSAVDEMEDVASKSLPVIGKVAEKQHMQSFGRPAAEAPASSESWYPESRKKLARHA